MFKIILGILIGTHITGLSRLSGWQTLLFIILLSIGWLFEKAISETVNERLKDK